MTRAAQSPPAPGTAVTGSAGLLLPPDHPDATRPLPVLAAGPGEAPPLCETRKAGQRS